MAQLSSLYELRNVILAHDALIELTSKPGAKVTITQSPFSVTIEYQGDAFTAHSDCGTLDQALFKLAQQCSTKKRFKTSM